MKSLPAFILCALAFAFGGATARASTQVWCSLSVRYIVAQNVQGQPDNVYVLTLENENAWKVARAKIDVMDDARIYELDVPVREPVTRNGITLYEPVAIHYAKPAMVRTAWITQIADDEGHTADCYPVALNVGESRLRGQARVLADEIRTAASRIDIPSGDGIAYITPDTCKQRYVDATAADPVTPQFPTFAQQWMTGGPVTVLIRVDIAQTGQLIGARVLYSAGIESLDRASLEAAVHTKYLPKKVNCIPFASTYTFRATFAP